MVCSCIAHEVVCLVCVFYSLLQVDHIDSLRSVRCILGFDEFGDRSVHQPQVVSLEVPAMSSFSFLFSPLSDVKQRDHQERCHNGSRWCCCLEQLYIVAKSQIRKLFERFFSIPHLQWFEVKVFLTYLIWVQYYVMAYKMQTLALQRSFNQIYRLDNKFYHLYL